MKNNNIVKPVGLKGNEALDRMRSLMGVTPINENVKPSVIELTKEGPDGNIYAIVRENHEYYIKTATKSDNLVAESFNYIGGLQNKKDKAYPSYAKAIKMLNLKFISLNEAKGISGSVNVFLDDNLISEHHPMKADATLSPSKSFGDNSEYVIDKKGEKLEYDADEDTETSGDNVAKDGKSNDFETVELSENEKAIDEMIDGVEEVVETKKGYSISKAIAEMDSVIESVIDKNDKIDDIIKSLKTKGLDITPNNISIASLFIDGGTISDDEAAKYLKKKI